MVFLFMIAQAFAGQPCFDLIDKYAAENCFSPPASYEIDLGEGPVVTFDCDLGDDIGQDETFAVFSLATDISSFFEDDPVVCSGGDLWIDAGIADEPSSGVVVSWLSWTMFHDWDDDRAEGNMTHLDDWMIEQSVTSLHRGDSL
jgi:hypothetical protein